MDRDDDEPAAIALADAVRAGDQEAFRALFDRHRRELQVHAYRMLGSFSDTEDLLQETFLRAWNRRASFEGRASVRAWLYRIATNACLDVLRQRKRRRALPFDVVPPIGPESPMPADPGDVDWLEPFPDHLLSHDDPAAAAVTRESLELVFLAAIHHLSPVQRAVIILRDLLGWSARETAQALETTEAAVKSALQRGRPILEEHLPARRPDASPPRTRASDEERAVLDRYIAAMQADDVDALAAVLRDDVRVAYPQVGIWCDGAQAFIKGSREHAPPGDFRFVATTANLQPAVAIYHRAPGAPAFALTALELVRVVDGRIAEIVDFDPAVLSSAFGLPPTL
ncbi:MAG: sigma-70 family RNA polymerase sigma factor [Kofleriaceae bacterium]|nr:MAG: sigma-70 family RNA polymerase sigma factor [Kofleriaceae bacterium]MBZ0234775.1 RNA polymerase subunit sigma-70 [Kofleriaceae bacterium]